MQSNIAYWAGRYDDAAQLVDTAMDDATDGTAVLRLTSQRARIRAAQGDTPRVAAALDLASAASTEPGAGEPGVLAFATGKAAYYASEAHRELGGTAYLDAAVSWARTAVDEFFAGPVLHPQLIAAARIDLARAHLARGEIDAVAEHIEPVIRTGSDQRTVPVTRRMSSLGTVLDAYSAIAPGRIAGLRDSIADFCSDPAIGPAVPDRGAAG
ncbi:hypothetical protein AFB00_02335 [Pseudonocardia sp. HH130630-07]|nr:hypothetical protein AFB00_02335 [Pseudonocardia sp. HH130630-07]